MDPKRAEIGSNIMKFATIGLISILLLTPVCRIAAYNIGDKKTVKRFLWLFFKKFVP